MTAPSSRFSVISVPAATSFRGTSGPAQAPAHTCANPAAVGPARLLLGSLALAGVALASLPPLRRRAPTAALAETPS